MSTPGFNDDFPPGQGPEDLPTTVGSGSPHGASYLAQPVDPAAPEGSGFKPGPGYADRMAEAKGGRDRGTPAGSGKWPLPARIATVAGVTVSVLGGAAVAAPHVVDAFTNRGHLDDYKVREDDRGPMPFASASESGKVTLPSQSASQTPADPQAPPTSALPAPSKSAAIPEPAKNDAAPITIALPGRIIPMEGEDVDPKSPENGTFLGAGFDEDGDIALFKFKNGRWHEVETVADGYIQHISGGPKLLGIDKDSKMAKVWMNNSDPENSNEAQHFQIFHGNGELAHFKLTFRVKDGQKQMVGTIDEPAANKEGNLVDWPKSGILEFGIPSVGADAPGLIKDDPELQAGLATNVAFLGQSPKEPTLV
jgi:hypothetical protein